MQLCKECNIEKELSDFYFKASNKNGHSKVCKKCMSLQTYKNCEICNKKCRGKGDIKKCKKCTNNISYENYSKLTLGDKTYDHLKYAKYSYIRFYARKEAKKLGWDSCIICGYNEHVEIAHIKAISEYPPETLLIEINNIDNLVALCPNCHWEFDNKKNKLEKIEKLKSIIKRGEKLKPEARKVIRPAYEQLLEEIQNSNYCAVGRKYNVTDNTIRKWVKMYEKYSGSSR